MEKLKTLIKGEILRLKKYYLFHVNLIMALLWVIIIGTTKSEEIGMFLPFIIFFDASFMTLLLVGATLFYEKKESTIKTMLITPIRVRDYVISKFVSSFILSLETLILVILALEIFKIEVDINYFVLLGAMGVTSLFHSLLSIIFSFKVKNFTEMLMTLVAYNLIFLVPPILLLMGIIPESFSKILLFLPTQACLTLVNASIGSVDSFDLIISIIYMLLLIITAEFFIEKKFYEYALRDGV